LFFLFATALWAFAMLVAFVGINPIVIAIFLGCFIAIPISWKRKIQLPNGVWLVFSLLALAGSFFGWFILFERLYSVVYLFLYLEINKLWTGRESRDYLQIYALTFFQVLAASVSTASLFYAPALFIYLFLILGGLISVTIKRDAELALDGKMQKKNDKKPHPDVVRTAKSRAYLLSCVYKKKTALSGGFLWLCAMLICLVLVGSGIFFIIPRVQQKAFFQGMANPATAQKKSGFSDRITFTGVDDIQTDPTIVARAFPISGHLMSGGYPTNILRLRGTSLNYYDGRSWSKRGDRSSQVQELLSKNRNVYFDQPHVYMGNGTHRVTRITLEPNREGYLFGTDRALKYEFASEVRLKVDPDAESLQMAPGTWGIPLNYEVESVTLDNPKNIKVQQHVAESGNFASALTHLTRRLSERFRSVHQSRLHQRYLQLPEHADIETVRRLAHEWSQGYETASEISKAIELELKRQNTYSLNIEFASKEDHLTQFLVKEHRGHCEYFATSMVLMLRTLEIPSRIVNGYATDEWVNAGGGYFLVRQEHAHSWVEVYLPNQGWATFDPTPNSGIGNNRIVSTLYHAVTRWMDSVRLVWYNTVIDFDARDQWFMYNYLFRGVDLIPELGSAFKELVLGQDGGVSPVRSILILFLVLSVVTTAWYLSREVLRMVREKKQHHHINKKNRSENKEKVRLYLTLLVELEKRHYRSMAQTPLEYAHFLVASDQQLETFLPLTKKYYDARFNNEDWSAEDCQRINALLRLLGTGRKEHK
jgi:transglutaminase-like putative cysteine protease